MAISDDQRAQVIHLHTQGLSRNEIARATGVSAGSVTNICRDAGLSFDGQPRNTPLRPARWTLLLVVSGWRRRCWRRLRTCSM